MKRRVLKKNSINNRNTDVATSGNELQDNLNLGSPGMLRDIATSLLTSYRVLTLIEKNLSILEEKGEGVEMRACKSQLQEWKQAMRIDLDNVQSDITRLGDLGYKPFLN